MSLGTPDSSPPSNYPPLAGSSLLVPALPSPSSVSHIFLRLSQSEFHLDTFYGQADPPHPHHLCAQPHFVLPKGGRAACEEAQVLADARRMCWSSVQTSVLSVSHCPCGWDRLAQNPVLGVPKDSCEVPMADVHSDLNLGMPRKTRSVWFQGPEGPGKPQACPWSGSNDLLIQRAIQSHNAIHTWTTAYLGEQLSQTVLLESLD